MHLDPVSIKDWISLAAGLIGLLIAWLGRQDRLPAWVRKWLKRIGQDKITDAIERAAAIAELTPDQRQKEAAIYIQRIAQNELGFPVPQSVANLLIEHVYQVWKRARR
jgi:hypothetical protein